MLGCARSLDARYIQLTIRQYVSSGGYTQTTRQRFNSRILQTSDGRERVVVRL